MNLIIDNLTTVAAIVALMTVIAGIEILVPLRARGHQHRAHLGPNLALTFITFASNVLLNAAVVLMLLWLEARDVGLLRSAGIGGLAAGVIGVLVLDFAFYLLHVAMHASPGLWRIHRVHHCDPVVDVTTTIRQHPAEGLLRYAAIAAAAATFGIGVGAFAVYRAGSAIIGLFEHANLRIPCWVDRALSLVTTSPGMHRLHHSRNVRETNSNYGNMCSWFDRLFATFTPTERGRTVECGLDGLDTPAVQSTAGLLRLPFQPTT